MADTLAGIHLNAPVSKAKEQYLVTRRFAVQIHGSLSGFAGASQQAATWSPINGKVGDVFCISDIFESTPDVGTTAAVLSNLVLHRVTMLETKNNFPLNLSVTMACVPSEETTKTGHKYALTTIASTHQPNPTKSSKMFLQREGLEVIVTRPV